MSPNPNPWRGEPPPPEPPADRNRLFLWLGFMAAGAGGLWLLFQAFPGAIASGQDTAWLIYGLVWASFLSLRLLSGGPIRWGEKAKHAAIWLGIIAVIAVGFAYRGEVMNVVNRVRAEGSGGYPVATGAREMVVVADASGGYFVMGKVNGKPVRFLVDTGASDTVLSPADAERAGIDVGSLTFDRSAETANGVGYGAAVVVDELSVGSISMAGMAVVVNQAPMRQSLLGMSFLSRLESFHFRDGRLYLTARE